MAIPRRRKGTAASGREQTVLPGMSALEPRASAQAGRDPRQEAEYTEQRTLFYWLRTYERRHPDLAWVYAVPNGLTLDPTTAKKAHLQGIRAGIWDMCVPCVRASCPGLYVEMKWADNDLSANQEAFGAHAAQQGYRCVVCWCWVDALETIVRYLAIDDVEIERVIGENRRRYPRAKPPRLLLPGDSPPREDGEEIVPCIKNAATAPQ